MADETEYAGWSFGLKWVVFNALGQILFGVLGCGLVPFALSIFFLSGLDFTIAGALFTIVGALFGALVGATIGSLPRDTIEKEEHLTGRLLLVSVVAGAVVWAVIWALVWAFGVAIIEAIELWP